MTIFLLVQRLDQKLGGRAGRSGILAGDELAVGDGVDAPVLHLGKNGAEARQLVLDKEGRHFRQSDRFLLAVGEAGHGLACDERLAVCGLDVPQRARGMADEREGLPAARKDSISLIEFLSSARSHIGPWPPG